MTWVKLDDQLHAHPKAARAWAMCDASLGLHMLAMSYSGCFNTQGHVAAVFVAGKIPGAARRRKAVDALVAAGLWKPVEDGWQIHDWDVYNGDAESREAVRKAKVEAGRKGGQAKAAAVAAASESASTDVAPAKQKPSSRAAAPAFPSPSPLEQHPPDPPQAVGTALPIRPPGNRQRDLDRFEEQCREFAVARFPDLPSPHREQMVAAALSNGLSSVSAVDGFVRRWSPAGVEEAA